MKHPSFDLLYGPLKYGKTLSCIAAFPNATFIAAPGALGAAATVLGIEEPQSRDLETFEDIDRYLKEVKGDLAIDDGTLIADRTVAKLAKSKSGYDLWEAVLRTGVALRDNARRLGKHVAMTTHDVPAEVKNGVRLPGGPAFPGQIRRKFPAAVDFLGRVEPRTASLMDDAPSFGWPMVVRTLMTDDWLAGSRFNTPDFAPLNLREILNLAGYRLPRLKGLEWQETLVGAIADGLKNRLSDADACRKIFAAARATGAKKKFSPKHVEWAIDDAYSRAVLSVAAEAHGRRLYG